MMVEESVEQGTVNANPQDGSLAMAPHKKCRRWWTWPGSNRRPPACKQGGDKPLNALSGVAYTENQRDSRSLKCPEVVPSIPVLDFLKLHRAANVCCFWRVAGYPNSLALALSFAMVRRAAW